MIVMASQQARSPGFNPPLKMFARSAAEVILRTRQAVGAKKTMITAFFTAKKRIALYVLP
jgi:hypothetical protein